MYIYIARTFSFQIHEQLANNLFHQHVFICLADVFEEWVSLADVFKERVNLADIFKERVNLADVIGERVPVTVSAGVSAGLGCPQVGCPQVKEAGNGAGPGCLQVSKAGCSCNSAQGRTGPAAARAGEACHPGSKGQDPYLQQARRKGSTRSA
jgi:hypothetical protein